jgi:hypothetical protein
MLNALLALVASPSWSRTDRERKDQGQKTAKHSKAQRSTAKHSEAQQTTANHSEPQQSKAQQSTAKHSKDKGPKKDQGRKDSKDKDQGLVQKTKDSEDQTKQNQTNESKMNVGTLNAGGSNCSISLNTYDLGVEIEGRDIDLFAIQELGAARNLSRIVNHANEEADCNKYDSIIGRLDKENFALAKGSNAPAIGSANPPNH